MVDTAAKVTRHFSVQVVAHHTPNHQGVVINTAVQGFHMNGFVTGSIKIGLCQTDTITCTMYRTPIEDKLLKFDLL